MATKIIFTPKWLTTFAKCANRCEIESLSELSPQDEVIFSKAQFALHLALIRIGASLSDIHCLETPGRYTSIAQSKMQDDVSQVNDSICDAIGLRAFSKLPRSTDYVLHFAERLSFKDEDNVVKVVYNPDCKRPLDEVLLDFLEIVGARSSVNELFGTRAFSTYFQKVYAA